MDTVEQGLSHDQQTQNTNDVAQDMPLSLVDTVTLMLTDAGVADPEKWKERLHPEALSSPDLNIQRFHINRVWNYLLMDLPTEEEILMTRNARGCLVNGKWELSDWIHHFKKDVIPCAIKMHVVSKKTD